MNATRSARDDGRAAGLDLALFDASDLRAELDALTPSRYDDADVILSRYVDGLDDLAARAADRRGIPEADRAAWCAAYVGAATEKYRDVLRAWEGAA